MEEFLEFMSMVADSELPATQQSNNATLTADSNIPSEQFTNRDIQSMPIVLDDNLYDYSLRLKLESPDNPPFIGPRKLTNYISPNLPKVTEQSLPPKKQQWVISKLWEATAKTKDCTQQDGTNDKAITDIACQSMTHINLPENATNLEKQQIINFNKEIIKLFINSAEELEEKKAGSSHAAVSLHAKRIGVKINTPPALVSRMGELFLSPAAYSLEHHSKSVNELIWGDLAGIPVNRAQGAVGHLSTNFLQIAEAYNDLLNGQKFILPLSAHAGQSQSLQARLLKNTFSLLESGNNAFDAFHKVKTPRSNILKVEHIGGGIFLLIFTSGLIIYIKMSEPSRAITSGYAAGEVKTVVGPALVRIAGAITRTWSK